MSGKPKSLKRRKVVVALGVTAGAAALAGLAGRALKQKKDDPGLASRAGTKPLADVRAKVPAPGADRHVRALFGSLAAGSVVGGYTIEAVYPLESGGIPVVMSKDGDRFQVDVLKRDPAGPKGVGETHSLAVYVSNRGDGKRATVEVHGLGALALATALTDSGETAGKPPHGLLTLRQRSEKFPGAAYRVL